MEAKLTILKLSENLKWSNWPTWLKGIFLLWPSLGPAYLFLTRTPTPTGSEDLTTIMTNIEYQNYFIVVFLGFWSINLIILGITWLIGGLTSDMYRDHLREKSKKDHVSLVSKNYPIMEKKRTKNKSKKKYPVLRKKRSSKRSDKWAGKRSWVKVEEKAILLSQYRYIDYILISESTNCRYIFECRDPFKMQ